MDALARMTSYHSCLRDPGMCSWTNWKDVDLSRSAFDSRSVSCAAATAAVSNGGSHDSLATVWEDGSPRERV
ncbi:hypothetical protein E2C01_043050 [Portunus trituberculatus]|uniref:Uncharacterized protein n=1 Tax=Portunus trituberculatus TaxID=210409 RepID=A0A5B7FRV8_PORTR|nr:hypothetical protein [Portunus trituberculatus]